MAIIKKSLVGETVTIARNVIISTLCSDRSNNNNNKRRKKLRLSLRCSKNLAARPKFVGKNRDNSAEITRVA